MSATTTEVRLTGNDFCDACGFHKDVDIPSGKQRGIGRALVRAHFLGGTSLDFCKNHFEANESALRASAIEIIDQRKDVDVT